MAASAQSSDRGDKTEVPLRSGLGSPIAVAVVDRIEKHAGNLRLRIVKRQLHGEADLLERR